MSIQYKEAYSNKTGISVEDIETNWAKGDVWLSAKEAVAQKFITGVTTKATITKETKALFQACGSPTIPQITNNKKPLQIMDQKILALSLGLPENASEETIKAAIQALKSAAAETASLKSEKQNRETIESEAKVETLINGAVTAKKINASQAESLKTWAKSDYKACETYIQGLSVLPKVSASISTGVSGTQEKEFKAMSDSEKQSLAEEDPEAFKSAYLASLS